MAAERPEKTTVRGIWIDVAMTYSEAFADDPHPLFLTLSGAEGRDIRLLIDNDLLEVTETGAIPTEFKHRVIAIESSSRAAAILQKQFPGLKVLDYPFQNLLSGESLLRFPHGEQEEFCRARVVNLDLNQPLMVGADASVLDFPILALIRKLCQVHAQQRINWSLCLTLHAETVWPTEASLAVQEFLAENFAREPVFAQDCRGLLGNELFDAMNGNTALDFASRPRDEQQRVLMVLVPKKIAQLVHQDGWRVETSHNLRYGGTPERAPMVTWVIHFTWDPAALRRPDRVYRDALTQILSGAGRIAEDGSIS